METQNYRGQKLVGWENNDIGMKIAQLFQEYKTTKSRRKKKEIFQEIKLLKFFQKIPADTHNRLPY